MAKKKGFALRIDEDLLAAIDAWATQDFRSVNGQIEFLLHHALKQAGKLPEVKTRTENSTTEK